MANNRIRYNWGVCTNRDADGNGTPCECCASKEKQKILASHEFICRVCNEPLQKVQAPKSFWDKYKVPIIGLAAVAVIGGVGAGFALSGGEEAPKATAEVDSTAAKVDSVKVEEEKKIDSKDATAENTAEQNAQQQAQTNVPPPTIPATKKKEKVDNGGNSTSSNQSGYGRVNLGYGTYMGELKDGKPHGHGIITYTSSHKIVSSKDFVANPGDTYEGEFRDGRPASIGIWIHDGERTGVKP